MEGVLAGLSLTALFQSFLEALRETIYIGIELDSNPVSFEYETYILS
jgi:hypothetical protein